MISLPKKAITICTLVCPMFMAISTHAFTPQPMITSTTNTQRLDNMSKNTLLFASKDADMTDEERDAAMEKALKAMTAFTNKYTENTNTKLCQDKSIPAVVIKGLAEHKISLGTPLCPCRFYEDKEKEAKEGYWNCPCVPMRERHECHCMLFLTEDNDFAGEETNITFDEVKDLSGGFSNDQELDF